MVAQALLRGERMENGKFIYLFIYIYTVQSVSAIPPFTSSASLKDALWMFQFCEASGFSYLGPKPILGAASCGTLTSLFFLAVACSNSHVYAYMCMITWTWIPYKSAYAYAHA